MTQKLWRMLLVCAALLAFGAAALADETVTIAPGEVVEAEDDAVYHSSGTKGDSWPGYWYFYSNGSLKVNLSIPRDGYYRLLATARGKKAGDIWPFFVYADTQNRFERYSWYVNSGEKAVLVGTPKFYSAGVCEVTLSYSNDGRVGSEDRDLFVDWIALASAGGPDEPMDPTYSVKGQPLSSYGAFITAGPATPNYLPDGDFEGAGGWSQYNPSVVDGTFSYNYADPAAARFGAQGGSITSSNSANKLEMINSGRMQLPPRAMAEDLIFTGWYKKAPETVGTAYIAVKYYDSSGGYVGGGPKVTLASPTEEWQYFSFVVTVSQMASTVRQLIVGYSFENGVGTLYYDSLAIYPAAMMDQSPLPLTVQDAGSGQLRLSWPAQANNKLYEIHKGATADFTVTSGTLLATVEDGGVSYVDSNPRPETLAYYKVRAVNKMLSAQDSAARVNDIIPPQRPQAPAVSTEKGGIVIVTWQSPSQAADGEYASRYLIYKSQDPEALGSSQPVHEVAAGEELSWWDRDVEPGVGYYYAVKCLDRVDNESLLSPASAQAVPTPDVLPPSPAAEAAINSTAVRGGLTLTWKKPAAAAEDGDFPVEYRVFRSEVQSAASTYQEVQDNYEQIGDPVLAEDKTEFSFLDNQVDAGKPYYYYIASLDYKGNGAVSVQLTAQSQAAAMPKPLLPDETAPAVNGAIAFTWEEPVVYYEDDPAYTDTVVSYTLEYAAKEDFSDAVAQAGLSENSFALQERLDAGTYWWRVRAHYASTVRSPFSSPNSFVVVETAGDPLVTSYLAVSPSVIKTKAPCVVSYVLSEDAVVSLKIFNSKGRVVKVLVDGQFQAAQTAGVSNVYTIRWNGDGASGYLADGLYIAQLVAERPQKRKQVLHRRFQVFRAQ
jgi:hypothetical protein